MSKTAIGFFTLLLVLASCFIAGCSSLPFSSETPPPAVTPGKVVNTGQGSTDAAALEAAVLSQRYSFEDVTADLALLDLETKQIRDNVEPMGTLGTPGPDEIPAEPVQPGVAPGAQGKKQIKQVRGGNLNENGDAASWTFIVEHGGKVSIVSYSERGTTYSGSPGSVSLPEIIPGQIMSPAKLFEKNHDRIFNASQAGTAITRDLSLVGNNYTITISTKRGPSEILVFNAKTGGLIS
jgi:hypothetical protein